MTGYELPRVGGGAACVIRLSAVPETLGPGVREAGPVLPHLPLGVAAARSVDRSPLPFPGMLLIDRIGGPT